MKESIFNEYMIADDGVKLAFNSFSCSLAIVDNSYEKLIYNLKNLNKDNVPNELVECYKAAIEGHFIVDDEYDELLELKTKRNFQKYSNESLGLTIAPTLACNFECVYCYETSKPGIMSKNVSDALIGFVNSQSDHLKNLSISWYGGEPLLAKETIYELSEKFIRICKDKDIEYNAFIISNGSLLDDNTVNKLIEYKVTGIQITIDGPPAIHNERRVNKSGVGTFDLIIDNINKLLSTEKMDVIIRINVDKTNNYEVDELIHILSDRLINKNVKISFGQVTAYTDACRSIETTCYDNGEFAVELIKYQNVLKKYGFDKHNDFPYPDVKLNYCCAELMNSFVVDPEGYLYKCWNEVGNIENSVGNISETIYDITSYKNGKWLDRSPIDNAECSKCSLLPVCMGGCPHNDMVLNKEYVCDLIKYNIKDVMLSYYKLAKENEK